MLLPSRERGAVNILFLVLVLVLALIFGTLWFLQLQKTEELEGKLDVAGRRATFEAQRAAWARDYHNSYAQVIGGDFPTTFPLAEGEMTDQLAQEYARPFIARVQEKISQVLSRVDEGAQQPRSLFEAIEIPVTRYQTMKTRVNDLEATVAAKDRTIAEKDETIRRIQTEHSTQMEAARAQFESDKSSLKATNTALEETNRQVQARIDALVRDSEQERQNLNTSRNQALAAKNDLEGQVRSMKSELTIAREREVPDGRILSSDSVTGRAFIDITNRQGLRRGTRFKVYETGKGGAKIHKGWVTVTNVGPTMSEVRIDETVEGVGDIEAQDWLYNPVFDAESPKVFVFLGEFRTRTTREVAESILKNLGAKVEGSVTVRTDFLILGEKENEDADELTESQDYKNAMTWGIEVIRARDLEPFIKL